MKAMTVEEMQQVDGGITLSCGLGIAASLAGTFALGLASGGVGIFLVAYGISMGGWAATALGCAGK